MKTSDILAELGEKIIECREVPRRFFDRYGEEVVDRGKAPYNRTFFKVPEHSESTLCYHEAEKADYGIYAIALRRMHCEKTEFDREPPLMVVYPFSRIDVGCAGETLKRASCSQITEIKDTINYGYISGGTILEIGRNEGYRPVLDKKEKKRGGIIAGEVPNKMKIVPLIPREDAKELLERFKGLLNYYKNLKPAEPAKL